MWGQPPRLSGRAKLDSLFLLPSAEMSEPFSAMARTKDACPPERSEGSRF